MCRYVWLGANSVFKADSDLAKYEKARKLKEYIDDIRANYTRDWEASDVRRKQVGKGRGGALPAAAL
jgi:DNA topoisomerase-1